MILPSRQDAIHKAMMYRLLSAILDNPILPASLFFKGGSCAAMLGYLDRFSIDLDFDLGAKSNKDELKKELEKVIGENGFEIGKKSKKELFYLLKYSAAHSYRNSLKLSAIDLPLDSNLYEAVYLPEIDRFANCQTIETMFANKLVAVIDRFEKHKTIAGRDIYDIHHFFERGFKYRPEIIAERRNISAVKYLRQLREFIESQVNLKIIDQDLNYLLPPAKFQLARKTLKPEILTYLEDEIKRIS